MAEIYQQSGPFQIESRIGGVIFFEDIKVGLIAVSKELPSDDTVLYSRFLEPTLLPTPNHFELN